MEFAIPRGGDLRSPAGERSSPLRSENVYINKAGDQGSPLRLRWNVAGRKALPYVARAIEGNGQPRANKNHLTVSPPPTYIDNEGKIPLKGGHDMKDTDLVKQQNDYIAPPKTLALIGSATYATKARDALANAAIRAQIIKHSASRAHGGCIYGVVFASHQRPNVAFVLDRAGIFVREYLEYKA